MSLSVCLLAAEVAPLSKTGGLADVAGALAKHLAAAGHDVRLFTPLYCVDRRLEISDAACRWAAADAAAGRSASLCLLHFHHASAGIRCAGAPGRLPGAVRAAGDLHDRSGRAPEIPRLHPRRAGRLPAPAVVAADPALQRLAHRLRAALRQGAARGRAALRAHALGADHPQHRLPGHIQRARPSATWISAPAPICCTRTTCARERSIRCATESCTRTRSPPSVPPMHVEICTDEYGMGLQDSLRMRARRADRHPERRRLPRLGPAQRPVPAAAFRSGQPRAEGGAEERIHRPAGAEHCR